MALEGYSKGFQETVNRLTGIMADGKDRDLEYLKGVEGKLADALNKIREAIGHAETMEMYRQFDEQPHDLASD